MTKLLNNTFKWLWYLTLILTLLFIVFLVSLKYAIENIPVIQSQLNQYLNKKFNTELTIGSFEASWMQGKPELLLRNLKLQTINDKQTDLSIDKLNLQINIGRSLIHRTLAIDLLNLDNIELNITETSQLHDDGTKIMAIAGIPIPKNSQSPSVPETCDSSIEWLNHQGKLNINSFKLGVKKNNRTETLHTTTLQLINAGGYKLLNIMIKQPQGTIQLKGTGLSGKSTNTSWQGTMTSNNFYLQNFSPMPSNVTHKKPVVLNIEAQWNYWYPKVFSANGTISSFEFSSENTKKLINNYEYSSTFLMQKNTKNLCEIWLHNNHIKSNDINTSLEKFYLSYKSKEGKSSTTFSTDSIALQTWKNLILELDILPEKSQNILKSLNPSGTLSNASLKLHTTPKNPLTWETYASLKDISIDTYVNTPSAKNINGYAYVNNKEGYVKIKSENLQFGLTSLFKNSWSFDEANAYVKLFINKDSVELAAKEIHLTGKEGHLSGKLRLDIPLATNKPIFMGLSIGMHKGNLKYFSQYLPIKKIPQKLNAWLDELSLAGEVSEGGFLYNGFLGDANSRWGLFINVHKAYVHYDKHWPDIQHLEASLEINNDKAIIYGKRGSMLDNKLEDIKAQINLTPLSSLTIGGAVHSHSNTLINLLKNSPINDMIPNLKKLSLNGDFTTKLDLNIPLDNLKQTSINVSSKTANGIFSILDQELVISKIKGEFNYSSNYGVSSKNFTAKLFDNPVIGNIKTLKNKDNNEIFNINWGGVIDPQIIKNRLPPNEITSHISGSTIYKANLFANKNTLNMKFSSTTEGLNIDLPQPFTKPPETKTNLNIELIKGDKQNISFNFENIAKGMITLDDKYQIAFADIIVGNPNKIASQSSTNDNTIKNNAEKNIKISGYLDQLNLKNWSDLLTTSENTPTPTLLKKIRIENLFIKQILHNHITLDDVSCFATLQEDKSYYINIVSPRLTGSILTGTEISAHKINIEKINISKDWFNKSNDLSLKQNKMLQKFFPSDIPKSDVFIKQLNLDKMTFDLIRFETRPLKSGLKINNLKVNMATMTLDGTINWHNVSQKKNIFNQPITTEFKGSLSGSKIDQLQKIFDMPVYITAKNSVIKAQLNWPTPLTDISLGNTSGLIEADMKSGALSKVEENTGTLKLFGILNTNSLLKRLKLDFSDLYSSGLTFDTLTTQVAVQNTYIKTIKPIEINGSNSSFTINGHLNYAKNTIDANMTIVVPLTANLPIMSILLGTAPYIAGILYVTNKLVGKRLDKLGSIEYKISGSLDSPKIALKKVDTKRKINSKKKNKVSSRKRQENRRTKQM